LHYAISAIHACEPICSIPMRDKIKCPNCGHGFDVEEALSGQLQAHFKAEFEKKVQDQAKIFQQEKDKLEKERLEFQTKKEKENEIFKAKLEQRIQQETEKIQNKTKSDFELELKSLKEQFDEKNKEVRTLKQQEINLKKRELELEEKAKDQELLVQQQLLEKQKEIEDKARAKEREANTLKEREFQKQLEDQKKLIEEMKRKAEQGSMQMQGEVQELALEELLKLTFPFDMISEVSKGIRGADVVQTVVNAQQIQCGTIVFESKRTKNFDQKWIDKLKQDQMRVKGDIAVLVTETLPNDWERFDFKDGVWICHFNEVKSLTKVLREVLIKAQTVAAVQVNKGDKMELLYNYLTSNDFTQKIKRIIETYDTMSTQLNSEKKAMNRMWATREKQIWLVQENLSALFGDIKGIAGNAIDSGNLLELNDPSFDE